MASSTGKRVTGEIRILPIVVEAEKSAPEIR